MSKKTLINLVLALAMLLTMVSAASGAPPAQEGQTYTVKLGDNLWTLAEKYLGSGPAYWAIVGATNAEHETDPSFAYIEDPSLIHPGWKLLIPSPEEAAKYTEVAKAGPTSATIVMFQDPPSFNHAMTDTGYEAVVQEMVLLALADLGPNGEYIPELATKIPTVENGLVVLDEENWTMDVTWKLRDDVYWEDGEPVTADDVVFTWEALADPETGWWMPGMDYTDSIEKVDDYTVLVHYSTVYPAYKEQFGGYYLAIWPEHYCTGDGEGIGNWNCNQDPLSDGPYLLEEWVAGDHLTFVRNPNYYEEGKPSIDTIYIRIVPDESVRKEMLLQGEADVDFWIIQNVIEAYEEAEHINLSYSTFGRWLVRLWPNQAEKGYTDPVEHPNPIFSDVRVRQAMRMAIDVDGIVEGVWPDSDLVVPVWTDFYREPWACDVPKPKYDLEGAKALLEEAGWTDTDGDGVRECHGCTTGAPEGYVMEAEFLTYGEWGETLELAHQLIAENLAEVGMSTELNVVQGTVLWDTYDNGGLEQTGKYELNLWDDGYAGTQITDFLWMYYSTAAMEPGSGGWNIERWSNEEFDALLDEVYSLDEEYRQDMFCQMAEILDEELPCIPLFASRDATGYNKRIEGVIHNGNDLITWNVADWKVVGE
jgi:peptide/nickel transport system substrate-binding protein